MAYVYIVLAVIFALLIAAAWMRFEDYKEQGVQLDQEKQDEPDSSS